MPLALVQCSDTFLQRKQRFVYLSAIDSCLLLHVRVIGASLITCEIDE